MIGPSGGSHCRDVRNPCPSPELLERVCEGDREARRTLFETWAPVVMRWCAHLGGPHVDPEDAAHDVLVTAMTRIHSVQHPDRFDAWMFGITRRVLTAHRRRGWLRRWIPGMMGDVEDLREGPSAAYERTERSAKVRAVLDELPADLREVLVLCDIEERPDEHVAALLGIPTGTAKSRLRRARERFEVHARRHDLGPGERSRQVGGGA